MSSMFNWMELGWLLPEIILLSMACVILLLDAFLPPSARHLTYQLSQGTLLITGVVALFAYATSHLILLNGMFVSDPMAGILKFFIAFIVFLAFMYSRSYLIDRDIFKGEYYVLGLFATLGMWVMVSAANLLTIYLGLELLSLSLYAMVAMHRDSKSASEAAMKYFVLGALASGMLLYGMSIFYGLTGSLELAEIAQVVSELTENPEQHQFLMFGLVFIIVGLAFKLGAVPFHAWVPDVYQGAPTAVTLFISSAPKLAAFAMMIRLLVDGLGSLQAGTLSGVESVYWGWQGMLIVLAVLSMALGNIVAIAQTNIKRMLAYSTISHVGFLLLGILTATEAGYAASMYYVIVYALMSLGGFGMVMLLSRQGFEADNIDDFKGLNERNSWYALIMMILMLSMIGVPPMVGFWAKWAVLKEVIAAGFMWLAIVAVIFSVIGAFYYLRIIKVMYMDKPTDAKPIEAAMDMRVAISFNGLLVLGLGLFPHSLMMVCLIALGVSIEV